MIALLLVMLRSQRARKMYTRAKYENRKQNNTVGKMKILVNTQQYIFYGLVTLGLTDRSRQNNGEASNCSPHPTLFPLGNGGWHQTVLDRVAVIATSQIRRCASVPGINLLLRCCGRNMWVKVGVFRDRRREAGCAQSNTRFFARNIFRRSHVFIKRTFLLIRRIIVGKKLKRRFSVFTVIIYCR